MTHSYLEFIFTVSPVQPGTEILIAELGYAGFESFVETETGVTAYVQKEIWSDSLLKDIDILKSEEFEISYTFSEIEQVNWNEEWEKNFDPILVDGKCLVRAPFHQKGNTDFEIVIEPKMSFGTGHHETTYMMLQYILENNFENKTVLDMGCGTAVLAILAEMKGARAVDAIDYDQWCVENSEENIQRNHCKTIKVSLGDASVLPKAKYDVVIANINRNILLADMEAYTAAMLPEATLYISGFYKEDLEALKSHCSKLGLAFVDNKERNNWVAAKFERS